MSITNDQNQMLIQMIKEFTTNELAPLDMTIDANGDYPDGLLQKVIDTGLLGITLPREYGGAGFDYVAAAEALEKLLSATLAWPLPLKAISKPLNNLLNMEIRN